MEMITHELASPERMLKDKIFTRCGLGQGAIAYGPEPARVVRKGIPSDPINCEGCLLPDVFVYGSNMQRGAEKRGVMAFAIARKGALGGQAYGPQGDSFAIPIRDCTGELLVLVAIERFVERFLHYAKNTQQRVFRLTRLACGRGEYVEFKIAPLFREAPLNVVKPRGWEFCECGHLGIQHNIVDTDFPGVKFCSVRGCLCYGIPGVVSFGPQQPSDSEPKGLMVRATDEFLGALTS